MCVRTVRKCVVFVVSFQMLGTRLNQFDRSTSCKTSWWKATSQCPACMLIFDQKERDLVMRSSVAIWSDHELSPSILEAYHILSHFIISHVSSKQLHRMCHRDPQGMKPYRRTMSKQNSTVSVCVCRCLIATVVLVVTQDMYLLRVRQVDSADRFRLLQLLPVLLRQFWSSMLLSVTLRALPSDIQTLPDFTKVRCQINSRRRRLTRDKMTKTMLSFREKLSRQKHSTDFGRHESRSKGKYVGNKQRHAVCVHMCYAM